MHAYILALTFESYLTISLLNKLQIDQTKNSNKFKKTASYLQLPTNYYLKYLFHCYITIFNASNHGFDID